MHDQLILLERDKTQIAGADAEYSDRSCVVAERIREACVLCVDKSDECDRVMNYYRKK